ncbi:T9SS type A sorting domain-containing protein [Catalinimonas sp. 4WD22]|uniref:T9SS type A sorting domain-containing protein n=1 Tax=Catalinimonas locisalis TaxID=3133978 RepID=UPI003100C065
MKNHIYPAFITLSLFLSLCTFSVYAQLILQWDKTLGGGSSDELSSVVSTANGGYLLAGTSYSSPSGDKDAESLGGPDYWIIRVDASGNKLWDQSYGHIPADYRDSDWDFLHTAIALDDGGFLFGGFSQFSLKIIRTDEAGNTLWQTGFVSQAEVLNKLIALSDGSFIAFAETPEYGRVIFKLDSGGHIVWYKTFASTNNEMGSAVQTEDGEFMVALYSNADASIYKSEDSKGGYDYWLIKLDAEGNVLWDKTIGGNGDDELHSILPTPDGGYLLGGYSNSDASSDKSENSKGDTDFWIVKTDDEGNVLWDKTIGGSASDQLYDMMPFNSDSYLLGGSSDSDASGDKSEDSKGEMDYWAVIVDSEGNPTWDKTIGSEGADLFESMTQSPDGSFVLAGTSNANASGDKSEDSRGGNDFWAVKAIAEDNTFIEQLSWVDAQSDTEVQAFKEGDVINLAELSTNAFSIEAHTQPETVDSVVFELTGPINHQQTERRLPYALFGDDNGNLNGREWPVGEYTITATPYLLGKASIATTLSFQLIQNTAIARPDVEWDKTLGGMMEDIPANAIPTPDGGYLIAGTSDSNSSAEKSEDSKGDSDYWVVKTDARGNKLWDKTFGGTEGETLIEAFLTEDGGFLLAGHSASGASGNKTATQTGNWLVKLDSQGNKIWDKIIEGDPFLVISPADDGEFLLLEGYFTYILTKIDKDGDVLWTKALEFTEFNSFIHMGLESIILTADRGFALGGFVTNFPDDLWLAKIDAEGNKLWSNVYSVGNWDYGKINISVSLDGKYLLGAEEWFYGYDVPVKPSAEYFVIKADELGNELWRKEYGGRGPDNLSSTIATDDGGFILAGHSGSADGDKTEPSVGANDYWLIKIDAEGNILWDKTIGGTDHDEPHHITMTQDGGLIISGSSNSDASGDKSEDSRGGSDFWIVKLEGNRSPLSVSNITLINADANQEIQVINHGDIINLNDLSTTLFNFEAHTYPPTVGSVQLALSGPLFHQQTENFAPYALFGDDPRGDYNGQELLPGQYQITATPYSDKLLKGVAGTPKTVSFTLIDSEQPLYAISLDLYDAVTDTWLFTLENGATVELNSIANHQLTVLMNTMPEVVGSVKVVLSGPINYSYIENTAPYALFRNSGEDYFGRSFPPGAYMLSATAYAEPNAQGEAWVTKTVGFYVTDVGTNTASSLRVFPVPATSTLNIRIESLQGRSEIKLLDKLGNTLLQQVSDQPLQQLDLSSLPKGIYFIKISDHKDTQTFRIVKE